MQRLLIPFCVVISTIILALVPLGPGMAQESAPIPQPRPDRSAVTSSDPSPIVEQPSSFAPVSPAPTSPETESPPINANIFTGAREPLPPGSSGVAQPLTLSAKISENGSYIDQGVVWRVFDPEANENGQMSLLFKSENPVVAFDLKPGEYLVHAAYGNAQASDSVYIGTGPLTKTLILEAGALRLNAAIAGDIPISSKNLWFDISTAGDSASDRDSIIKDVKPDDIIYLNAGIYHVISRFGNVNAEVRADLRVEAGQITDATLYHNAGKVSFRLASEPNGKAIADVEWTVNDADGKTVYSNLGAFPATILGEGDYSVIAKIGQNIYNRNFQIRPTEAREIELLTTVY